MLNATFAQENRTDRRGNGNGHSNGNGHHNGHNNYYAIDYRDAEPIEFRERGISFYVFPNGDFDFNTGSSSYIARRGGVPTTNIEERGPRGIKIEHDYYGRVKRIGSVYMTYNSFALTRIGGMRLFYNYHGEIVGVTGFVNGMDYGYQYNPCPAGYSGSDSQDDDYGNDDDGDFYYYKKDGSKEKMKKEDIDGVKKDAVERKG